MSNIHHTSAPVLKGVLFDLGSTLQEFTNEDWPTLQRDLNRDLYDYLAERGHGHRLPPLDEFIEIVATGSQELWDTARATMRGRPLTSLLPDLFERHGINDLQPEECILPWYRRVTGIIYVEDDVRPTLLALRDRGLKLGLVSNTAWPSAAHDPDLERFGLLDLLECRIYSCETGWEKPAPQIFHTALDCMGLPPEEVAFVGDFLRYDVAGAQAVGMKGIWKRVEGRPPDADDYSVVPDAVISRIADLPAALDRLYALSSR
jgi:putative hydrolase of the HAD superfamily